jgi:hypothetical protein
MDFASTIEPVAHVGQPFLAVQAFHAQFHPHPLQKIFTLSGNLIHPAFVYTNKTTRGVGG